MKSILGSFMMISVAAMLGTGCGPSRVAVRSRPSPPVIVRPAAPYANAYLVDGEWMWRGGHYVYVQPHYVTPKRGYHWSPGYWRTTRRGDVWMKGRWTR